LPLIWELNSRLYCGMSAENRNSLISRGIRCYATAQYKCYVSVATFILATIEELLDAVVPVRSGPVAAWLCNIVAARKGVFRLVCPEATSQGPRRRAGQARTGAMVHGIWGSYDVRSRYQATGEDTPNWENLLRPLVNCIKCELAIALEIFLLTICKCSINPITNTNPVYSPSITLQYAED
jgi:hypothetical protein